MKCIPIIDKAGKAIESLIDIQKDFIKYYESIDKNDVTLLTDFYNQLAQKRGSYIEFDVISEFIYDNLINIKNGIDERKGKENVLIIDDLDRIDPEHIFRILNIFSAHIDRDDDDSNKFGFDKILFVCDIENIRNIFAAKYGQNTDFSGYIDKFYSSEIFHFNNKVAIAAFIKTLMRNHSKNENNRYLRSEIDSMEDIIYLFVEGGSINLRQIFSNIKNLKNKSEEIGFIDIKGSYKYFPGYTIIWMCLKILGGQRGVLVSALEKAILPSDNKSNNININYIASFLLPLIVIDKIPFDINEDENFSSNNIEFKLKRERMSNGMRDCIYSQLLSPSSFNFNSLQLIFIGAVNELYQRGLLI